MGTSTNGEICYGIICDEGAEFPWDERGEIEEWWLLDVLKYKSPFELYDHKGQYINGVVPSKDKLSEYYDHRHSFLKANPLPVELVNYCSLDYPIYILAVPGSIKRASRGYPIVFDPAKLTVSFDQVQALLDFCEDHGIEVGEAGWVLSSYWG